MSALGNPACKPDTQKFQIDHASDLSGFFGQEADHRINNLAGEMHSTSYVLNKEVETNLADVH